MVLQTKEVIEAAQLAQYLARQGSVPVVVKYGTLEASLTLLIKQVEFDGERVTIVVE